MKTPSVITPIHLLFLIIAAGSLAAAQADVVKSGPGGYLTDAPKPCKPLPETIYRTPDLKGPILTSQWWSSLVWQPYSQPMFAHPLLLRCTDAGLTVSYHGAAITANKAGIFGSGHGKGDFTIGHSGVTSFPQADCGGYSDWFVTAVFNSGDAALQTSFGHGSPFVFCEIAGGKPTITFARPPQIWSGAPGQTALGVSINGHHYGIFGPSDSAWSTKDNKTYLNDSKDNNYFTIALLPDNTARTLALFARCAHNHVTDTRLEYKIDGGLVKSKYRFTLTPREGKNTGTLFALYPHQWKYSANTLSEMTYNSVRGLMKVGRGVSFETVVPVQGVLPMLPPEGIADRTRMLGYLRAEAEKRHPGLKDTYWEGKHLGKLATLSGVAEAAGAPEIQAVFIAEIKRRLEEWFTAAPGKEQPVFYYNANWGTLVGSRPSYGSDSSLNDHHFHYGYFIRAAAEVARKDPAWAEKWKPMVELLIRDIASLDRHDPMFPYMRCFDKYAGHSWASGDANFGDGNNQESSSESLNAWYGMILWGQFSDNPTIRDAGIFLFNTERTAVEEYWFDVSRTNYPDDFPHVALGMIWGGKGAFATWFSGDIDCIHGINWLPFTPASLYMGRHPDYVKLNHARIISVRKAGADYNAGWGDLVCMFNALHDPDTSAEYMDKHPNCKIEAGNTHAFMYHWIHTLKHLGLNDATVTADHPFAVVFNKNGRRAYVAYNNDPKPLKVTFSDGAQLTAQSQKFTVITKNGPPLVRMTSPKAVVVVAQENTVTIADRDADPDGTVETVEFPRRDTVPIGGLCSGKPKNGDYTWKVGVTEAGTPTVTFIPSNPGIGNKTLIFYYSKDPKVVFPGRGAKPGAPFPIRDANPGDKIYFYHTYNVPEGGERNTSNDKQSFRVDDCCK